jgi:hypothetical protein
MLRRHQFGGDPERRPDGKATGEIGQQTHDDQLSGVLHWRDQQRQEVWPTTPICMTVLRLRRSDMVRTERDAVELAAGHKASLFWRSADGGFLPLRPPRLVEGEESMRERKTREARASFIY